MMKINYLSVFFVGALILLLGFNLRYSSETVVFSGFANNKELNINLENPSNVKALFIQPGQRVKKGDVLLEVTRSSIAVTQSDINNDILNLQSQYQLWESSLKNSIRTLIAQKKERKNELESAIKKLESEMSINASLIKGIESIDKIKDENGNNPRQVELKGLKSDLTLSMRTFDSGIRKMQSELKKTNNPLLIQIRKLEDNLMFINDEEKSLNIVAPHDGIIGSIFCKVGENIPAFAPFLNMYEEYPNHVKAFVLENLILKVDINDTLSVQSISHPEESIKGIVLGMGTRIVEIPSRLRKNPELTTYGREIEIKIPSNNPFLQNEKVNLKKQTKQHKSFLNRAPKYLNQ